jgi:hypothetical protein
MSYTISVFKNAADNVPKDYDLDDWLELIIKPSKRLLSLVETYRNTFNDEDKRKLPGATISANFKDKRNLNNINQKLPFICIDIDRYSKKKNKASNDCVDMLLVKELFMSHPSCYFAGYSLSGSNIFAIIKLSDPDKLDQYFELLKNKLQLRGINIDESCKDYSRLRFFSYDSEAYYNKKAVPLSLPVKKVYKPQVQSYSSTDDDKVIKLIEVIKTNTIDITGVYEDWIKIAGALNNSFGENGRYYFHSISQYHPDYTTKKCDDKYDHCSKMNKTTLGSLFKIASDYGVRF